MSNIERKPSCTDADLKNLEQSLQKKGYSLVERLSDKDLRAHEYIKFPYFSDGQRMWNITICHE